MNILQILPELNVGGVETGTLDLAKYLVRLGHKAVVVSSGGGLVRELESSGAIHYQLPAHKKSLFTVIKTISDLREIIKKEKIDIVHARSRVPAWIAYFATRQTHTVFITTCHGYYKKHYFSNVMGWAKRVIVLSNVVARHMIEDFEVPYERIRLVPRGVDLEKFNYQSPDKKRRDEFNIGIIGRLTPIKGHLHFIKAMAKVARVISRFKIWIIGEAKPSKEWYKDELQVLVKRLGLWPYTEFLGMQRDIPAILSHLDLLVLATTTHEAFGRVIIEAQASGVPVVATRVGGVVDIIEDGKTGLLVPPADPNHMAEAIIKICKDIELSRNLAERAYKKVRQNYNAELMVKNTLEVYKEARGIFKILIIKLSSLGDVILSTAAVRSIRERFSHPHKISVLVGQDAKDVLLRSPFIDELLVCDFKDKDRGLNKFFSLAKILRKKNFDLVIDLQNNRRSHLLAYLSRSLERYGYANKKFGFLLNHRIKDEGLNLEPVAHQFRILEMLGIDLKNPHLELWPTSEDQRYIDEFLNSEWVSDSQRIIGINISASSRWLSKSWPFKHMVRFCEESDEPDIRILITGTEKDLAIANTLMSKVKHSKLINSCGKTTLNQLACLIKRCSVYISADSAPLHIAAACDTAFIALFGPTESKRHLPPAKNYVVIKKDLSCSPCYKAKCKTKECMELITPQEVWEAVHKLLK